MENHRHHPSNLILHNDIHLVKPKLNKIVINLSKNYNYLISFVTLLSDSYMLEFSSEIQMKIQANSYLIV